MGQHAASQDIPQPTTPDNAEHDLESVSGQGAPHAHFGVFTQKRVRAQKKLSRQYFVEN